MMFTCSETIALTIALTLPETHVQVEPCRVVLFECASALEPYNVDLLSVAAAEPDFLTHNCANAFAAITAVNIALYTLLNHIGIAVSGIIGHSLGEVAAAHADGAISVAEVLRAYPHSVLRAHPRKSVLINALYFVLILARLPNGSRF